MAKIIMIQTQFAPYAGIAYLNGAVLSKGHQFRLFLGNNINKISSMIAKENPDIIGFSCMTCFYDEILSISNEVKRNFKVPIIFGGPHPTICPEIINEKSIDIICRGEGEFALIELLDCIENKRSYLKIRNLWIKSNDKVYKNELRPLAEPLDNIPLINWSCYKRTPVQNSPPMVFLIRGCPYSCSYCFNKVTRDLYKGLGTYVRYFSIERSIQEIKEALRIFSHSPVVFNSDLFGMDLRWTDKLLSRYSQITDLPFLLFLRPELVTEKCVKILSKHKCHSVAIGVESGSERIRKRILNRNYSNKELMNVAERLHNNKIKFTTFNMIGIPTETEKEMWETIDINIKMRTDFPRGAVFTPMPGTKIVEIAKEKKYLDCGFSFSDIPHTILSNTILKKMNRDKIRNTLYFFQSAIIFPKHKRIIKRLIHNKPNIFFRLWFYLIYAHLHRKSQNWKLIPFIKYIYSNRRYL